MNAWNVVLVAAIVGGGALYAQQHRQQAQVGRLGAQISGLTEELSQARAQAAAPQRVVVERVVTAPQAAVAAAPAPQRSVPAEAPPPLSPEERAAHVELAFQRQAEDPAWSGSTRQQVARALSARLPAQSSVRGLDCRATLCRLELVYGSEEAHQEFVQRALLAGGDPLWTGGLFLPPPEALADGKKLAVLYLGRDGQALLDAEAL